MSFHGRPTQCKKGHQGSGPREEKEQKWWDTDYYSWLNRNTRLIGIGEAPANLHCKYTTDLKVFNPRRQRWSRPRRAAQRRAGTKKQGDHVVLLRQQNIEVGARPDKPYERPTSRVEQEMPVRMNNIPHTIIIGRAALKARSRGRSTPGPRP